MTTNSTDSTSSGLNSTESKGTESKGTESKGALAKIGTTLLKSNNIVFTFLRSIVSSQCASWIDLGLGFVLFSLLGFAPWLATGLGAIAGGVVNCIINYKFTFRAEGVSWKAVVVKYAMVWTGSLLLNSFGTQGLYILFTKLEFLEDIGFKPNGYYATARIIVSLLVSWFWNFLLQRRFVYRSVAFDKYILRIFR